MCNGCDMMAVAARDRLPQPKIPDEIMNSEWTYFGESWSVLSEAQLTEMLKFATRLNPNTILARFLDTLPELARTQLSLFNCTNPKATRIQINAG